MGCWVRAIPHVMSRIWRGMKEGREEYQSGKREGEVQGGARALCSAVDSCGTARTWKGKNAATGRGNTATGRKGWRERGNG